MNNGPLLFLGIFATLASSFWGLLLVPQLQLGRQEQVTNSTTLALYPHPRGGSAKQGAEVYRSLGCVECHSQQVRGLGSDLARGWGGRITVAQDYVGDYPVQLGALRIGPDLANIGLRQPNAAELLKRLYTPQLVTPGSMMPPYRFLYERRTLKMGQTASPEAVVQEVANGKPGYEIVPRPEAYALVDYLLSLRADSPLYEAPFAGANTNRIDTTSTNAPGTNVISTNASPASTSAPSASLPAPAK